MNFNIILKIEFRIIRKYNIREFIFSFYNFFLDYMKVFLVNQHELMLLKQSLRVSNKI